MSLSWGDTGSPCVTAVRQQPLCCAYVFTRVYMCARVHICVCVYIALMWLVLNSFWSSGFRFDLQTVPLHPQASDPFVIEDPINVMNNGNEYM